MYESHPSLQLDCVTYAVVDKIKCMWIYFSECFTIDITMIMMVVHSIEFRIVIWCYTLIEILELLVQWFVLVTSMKYFILMVIWVAFMRLPLRYWFEWYFSNCNTVLIIRTKSLFACMYLILSIYDWFNHDLNIIIVSSLVKQWFWYCARSSQFNELSHSITSGHHRTR